MMNVFLTGKRCTDEMLRLLVYQNVVAATSALNLYRILFLDVKVD